MNRAWLFVVATLVGTVAGQLVLKYAVTRHGAIPGRLSAGVAFIARALTDPLVLLGLALAFAASLTWIAALSRLNLGEAYAFMSVAFIVTTLLSALLLGESVSAVRWTGIVVVVGGLILVSRG